jgi:bifunctional oligoribonuclease and PAP phosphatase NrnA
MNNTTVSDNNWAAMATELDSNDPVLIATHTNPDADAIGSALGLYYLLKALGKRARVLLEEPIYEQLTYLDPDGLCEHYLPEGKLEFLSGERIFIVDAGALHRLGKLNDVLNVEGMRKMCIDHHMGDGAGFDCAVIDTSASSAGLLICELWDYLGRELTPQVAHVLYSAMATDTGFFRYPSTDGRTMRMAARLLEMGIDPEAAYRNFNESRRWQVLKVFSAALDTLESRLDGKLATLYVTREMIEREGVQYSELEGLIELPRSIRDTQVIALVVELNGDEGSPVRCKVSMRSKGSVDVNKVCRTMGGGGHVRASGAKMQCSIEETLALIEREVAKELNL